MSEKQKPQPTIIDNLLAVIGKYDCTQKLNKTEFTNLMKEVVPNKDNASIEKLFELLDANHDAALDFSEVVAGYAALATGSLKEKATLVFHVFDTDRDGYISKDDLMKGCQKIFSSSIRMSKRDLRGSLRDLGFVPPLEQTPQDEEKTRTLRKSTSKQMLGGELSAAIKKICEASPGAGDISLQDWIIAAQTNTAIQSVLNYYVPPAN